MKFSLGQCVATRDALEILKREGVEPRLLLQRHASGDAGVLDEEDKALNAVAIRTCQGRIFSSYKLSCQITVWVITESDRSATTILLPQDY